MSIDGMYSVDFVGIAGKGLAALTLQKGLVYGSDGDVQYDGTYRPSDRPGYVDLDMTAHVPQNIQLVLAYPPQPVAYQFRLSCSVKPQATNDVRIQTDLGAVNARIRYMRPLPV